MNITDQNVTSNKMNESQIAKINSICFFEIFKQIKKNCEIAKSQGKLDIIKYADLIRFVLTFEWIRDLFFHWDQSLYSSLKIYEYKTNDAKLIINLSVIYDGLQRSTQKERDIYFQLFIGKIREKKHLKEVSLIYTNGAYYEKHLDILEMIINALEEKKYLQIFYINMEGYALQNLSYIRDLSILDLNMRMSAEELVECCKSNPNLTSLYIRNTEFYGRLSDITLDGNILYNLVYLQFHMKPGIDAVEYAPLAKLPKLKELIICGEHEIGTLRHLFLGLAAKSRLQKLSVKNVEMNDDESHAISLIKSLIHLICRFVKAKSIGHLSALTELRKFVITPKHEAASVFSEILKFSKMTKTDSVLICFQNLKVECRRSNNELMWSIDTQSNKLSEYPLFLKWVCEVSMQILFIIQKGQKDIIIRNLIKEFARIRPQRLWRIVFLTDRHYTNNLNEKDLRSIALNCKEVLGMSAIRSLKSIDCTFSDLSNIYLLGELPKLEELTIKLPSTLAKANIPKTDDKSEAIRKLFINLASTQTLKYFALEDVFIDSSLISELVKVKSLNKLKYGSSDDESFKYIVQLPELEVLAIRSKHNFCNFSEGILQVLFSNNTNFEVFIDSSRNIITFNRRNKEITLELKEEADASQFASLGCLENCNSLVVTGSFNMESMQQLIKTLSTKQHKNLKVLKLKNIPINFKENLLPRTNAYKLEFDQERNVAIHYEDNWINLENQDDV